MHVSHRNGHPVAIRQALRLDVDCRWIYAYVIIFTKWDALHDTENNIA